MPNRFIQAFATNTALLAYLAAFPNAAGLAYEIDTQTLYLMDPSTSQVIPIGAPGAFSGAISVSATGVVTINPISAPITKTIALSSAVFTTLHSVPVALLPTPPAGFAYALHTLTLSFTYNTTAYTGGGVISAQYHSVATNILDSTVPTSLTQGTASFIASFIAAATASGIVVTAVGIDLLAASGDFTGGGDGTANVTIVYSLIKV